MIRSLCAAAVALAAAGLLVVTPASAASVSAATSAPAAAGKQAGYVAVPQAFHSAQVTVRVPTLPCTKKSPDRSVRLGLFGTESQAGVVRPVSLAVEATCTHGSARYRAAYRSHGDGGGLHVHRGDVVVLTLQGVESFEIDDKTADAGAGGGSAEGATHPTAERPVLIGAQWTGPRPTGIQADFTTSLVNHTKLAELSHHKHGNSPGSDVGALHVGRFRVTFAPRPAR